MFSLFLNMLFSKEGLGLCKPSLGREIENLDNDCLTLIMTWYMLPKFVNL